MLTEEINCWSWYFQKRWVQTNRGQVNEQKVDNKPKKHLEEKAKEKRADLDAEIPNKGSTTAKLIIEGVLESPGALDACLSEKQKKKWKIQ